MDPADLVQIESFVKLGSVLAGKYRIDRLLGVGGMGAVVEAHHEQLGQQVAIKFLLPRSGSNTRLAARFLREARTASKLKSAHVARVFDVDSRADGTPFMVMEYLHGESLRARFLRDPKLSATSIVDDLMEACVALAEAHALGIVHRDLKPANLFLAEGTGASTVRVLDFGISKVLDAAGDADVITLDLPIGSPPYMSPEQLTEPASVDHRTDIWSIGVVLYEGITGQLPFEGDTFARICANVLQGQPKPIDDAWLAPFPRLGPIINRCLAKDREQRFPNIERLCQALLPEAGERGKRAFASIQTLSAPRERSASLSESQAPSEAATEAGGSIGTLTATAQPTIIAATTEKRKLRVAVSVGAFFVLAVSVGLIVHSSRRADASKATTDAVHSRGATPSIPLPSASAEPSRARSEPPVAPAPSSSTAVSSGRVRVRNRMIARGGSASREFDPVFEERH
jgi:eukaryotic-like serine/threonine-protein kinase